MSLTSIVGLYNSLLLEAQYRGIPFQVLDSQDAGGRRIQANLFPGSDKKAFQDLGQLDGDIVVHGLLLGDDYAEQADKLRNAFRKAGPATLEHPWMGTLVVIQAPGRPPEFKIEQQQLRIATFTATFQLYQARQLPAPDTLQNLLDGLDAMRRSAQAMLARVLRPIALTLAAINKVESFVGDVAATWSTAILSVRDPLVGIQGSLPIGLLFGIVGLAPDGGDYPGAVGAALAGPSTAIAGCTMPPIPSAVAPGGATLAATPVDGRITAGLILTVEATMMPAAGAVSPEPAVRLAAMCFALADAAQAASDITFDSQEEAGLWRDRVALAMDRAAALAAGLVVGEPTAVTALWRSLVAARAAWLADMTATIGRLPAVQTFTPPGSPSIWQTVHYLTGDAPDRMLGMYLDLVARNDIRDPGAPPPGGLEVLSVAPLPPAAITDEFFYRRAYRLPALTTTDIARDELGDVGADETGALGTDERGGL